MPDLNVLCGIADVRTQSEQPVTEHPVVEVTPVRAPDPSTELVVRRSDGSSMEDYASA